MDLLLPVTRQGLRGGFTICIVAESYLTVNANANASKATKCKKDNNTSLHSQNIDTHVKTIACASQPFCYQLLMFGFFVLFLSKIITVQEGKKRQNEKECVSGLKPFRFYSECMHKSPQLALGLLKMHQQGFSVSESTERGGVGGV